MERKWIVGWKKRNNDPEAEWELTVDYVEEEVAGTLTVGEPYVELNGETLYFPADILSNETAALLSTLKQFVSVVDEGGGVKLQMALDELVETAYEAGRSRHIFPIDP